MPLAASMTGVATASDVATPVEVAALDCGAAADRAADRTGGRVLGVRPVGPDSCEVTLLVPNEGERPRRVVLVVPA